MDFTNAIMLTAAVFGIVALVKALFKVNDPRLVVAIVLVASFVATFLIAETVWADEQLIGGENLSSLDFWSKVTVALFLAGTETTLFLGLKAVKNIGENQP